MLSVKNWTWLFQGVAQRHIRQGARLCLWMCLCQKPFNVETRICCRVGDLLRYRDTINAAKCWRRRRYQVILWNWRLHFLQFISFVRIRLTFPGPKYTKRNERNQVGSEKLIETTVCLASRTYHRFKIAANFFLSLSLCCVRFERARAYTLHSTSSN